LHLYESKGPKEWGEGFDMVVVDPPVWTHPLARFLVPLVDGVILVADIKKTRRAYMTGAKREIEALGGKFYGCILNRHSDPIPSFVAKWLRLRR
jgi:Mrp family chromosome partitioning ATPase